MESSDIVINEAFPNPFQSSTTISYALAKSGYITMRLFDVTGRELRTFSSNELQAAGKHVRSADLSGLPGGVYLCAVSFCDSNGAISVRPILMTKE
jgi:hypothetical protein